MNPSIFHSNPQRRALLRWLTVAAAATPVLGRAQAYPSRPVRIVLPFAPGGSADVVTRLVARKLSQAMGQQFVVDNRPGASGNIGLEHVVRSPADGYTLVVVPDSNMTVNPHLFADMKFDPVKDTVAISTLTTIGVGLVVHPSVPATTVQELIAYSKSQKEGLSYGSPGTGTPHHLAGELLKQMTGANLTHVPYKGGAPAMQDVVAGHVPAGFVALAIAATQVRAGKLRLIAVTQGRRTSVFPNTPTVGESVRDFDVTSWLGMFAPAGTPADLVALLHSHIARALGEQDVMEVLAAQALDVMGGTPAELAERVRVESARWGALIRSRNIAI